jgi:hypothetical protein
MLASKTYSTHQWNAPAVWASPRTIAPITGTTFSPEEDQGAVVLGA